MNRLLRALTILIFALLQCIAPLVHAHIDDQQSDASILAQGVSHLNTADTLGHCLAEQGESTTITLPQKYQRDGKPIVSNTLSVFTRPNSWVFFSPRFALAPQYSSDTTLFRTPPAQAPPLLNSLTA
jgi:hypothetical protein